MVAVSTLLLCQETGHVSQAQGFVEGHGFSPPELNEAQTQRYAVALSFPAEGQVAHCGQHLVGQPGGLGHSVVAQDDDEFVSAKSGQHVTRTYELAQDGGNLRQECVAPGVAAAVIDHFEMVDIKIKKNMLAGLRLDIPTVALKRAPVVQ